MNKILAMAELCQEFTNLTSGDVEELARTANYLEGSRLYNGSDVFIDVFNDMTREALVVYHKPPKDGSSLYQENVVGQDALLKNEPGVMRTLQTSLNKVGLQALSQEGRPIRQDIYPIRNEQRTIGVIILETAISPAEFEAQQHSTAYTGVANVLETLHSVDGSVVDQLPEAILVYDEAGKLLLTNQVAARLYKKLGYQDQLVGMHYDNLSLDYTTFEYTLYQFAHRQKERPLALETTYLDYYFFIKKIWIEEERKLVVIIQDNTNVKTKEAEIISKSVAIQEIHHRVKNNLQSVVSLLRIQERRTESAEAKKVLRESVARIMAIAATHELLSKQVEDQVSLSQTLEMVLGNFRSIFRNSREIEVVMEVDPAIIITSEQMVTISLIVNELVQNVFDHAFSPQQMGMVKIIGKMKNDVITVSVQDDGNGFDVKKVPGTSLGLMIVTSYVKDKLKGKIKTESNKQGTTTCFCFEKNTSDAVRR